MKAPQNLPKEIAARNLLLIEQPPLRLGAKLKRITFADVLRLSFVEKLFPYGDTAALRAKILADPSMDREVTLQELRAFTTLHYAGHPRGIAYWQRVARLLWLQFAAYVEMRALEEKTVRLGLSRAENKARRKLAERKRLIERHTRERTQRKRWGRA